tara:strand:+ start:565 stop:714 length:150 start_codon:yes stop_codon:yes gene_type:complete
MKKIRYIHMPPVGSPSILNYDNYIAYFFFMKEPEVVNFGRLMDDLTNLH